MSDQLNLEDLKRKALDFIRCGIAANYSGERRDELMAQVYSHAAKLFDERDALKAEVERLTPLQFRTAPCHAACEATAFNIEIRKLKAEINKAKRALESAGYSLLEGAQEWKPPIGPSPSPLLDLIDSLRAELEAARKQEPFMWAFMFPNGDIAKEHFFDEFSANICWLYRVPSGRAIPCYASPVPAQQSETLEVLSSAIDTLKTVADNCEWSRSDFPVIARAEKLLPVPAEKVTHWSDCATNNGPAMEPGECDCGGYPPKEPPCATE